MSTLVTEQTTQQTTQTGHDVTDWRAGLPEDLRAEKAFESIKGKDWAEAGPALAKQFVHAQRLVGADKLILPTEKSTPEEIQAFRLKLGVPAKFEDYSYEGQLPKDYPVDKIDKTRFDGWRKALHEQGVPKAAAEKLIGKFLTDEHTQMVEAEKARVKALADNEIAVQQEYGAKFEETLNYARWTAKTFGDEKLLGMLEQTGLGSHPDVVRFFAKVGRAMADDKLRGGGGGGGGGLPATPEAAQMAIAEFERNPENLKALHDRAHPNHAYVVEQRQKLYAAAFPTEQPAG